MSDAPAELFFDEITEFLVSQPTPEAIINFRASSELDARLHDLLEKNREDVIAPDEKIELDVFLHYGHLLTMLKIKARQKLMI